MIKKLLLFALLLTVGFAVLYYAVGLDTLVGASALTEDEITGRDRDPDEAGDPGRQAASPPDEGAGFSLTGAGQAEAGITTEIRGRIEAWLGERVVELPGRTLRLPRATLVAEDSRPLPDGRQLLERVTIEFFDTEIRDGGAVNTQVALLTADTAYAELVSDARKGEPSIRSDKEVEMLGVELRTTAADFDRSTLAIARVFALVLEDRVNIDSQEREPFTLDIESDPPTRLVGEGLRARVPVGNQPVGRAELLVRHVPVLTYGEGQDALRLEAQGSLRFFEVVGSGTARVQLENDVRARIPGSSLLGDSDRGTTTVRGSRLTAHLARGKGLTQGASRQGTAALRSLRLWGEPATVDGPEGRLVCQEVVGVPSLDAQPFAISALGSETRLVIASETRDGRPVTTEFQAARHIHVVRPLAHLGPMLRAYGIPGWTAGSLLRRDLVVFEGKTTIDNQIGDASATADPAAAERAHGPRLPANLRLTSRDGLLASVAPQGGRILAIGEGETELVQPAQGRDPRTTVRGSDGFELRATEDDLHLQLGPTDDPEHRFAFERGGVAIAGSGSCVFDRTADERSILTLRSPREDISAALDETAGRGGFPAQFQRLGYLQSHLDGGEWSHLQASGSASTATWNHDGAQIDAVFRVMSSLGREGVLFEGTEADPARVDWTGDLRALGSATPRQGALTLRGAQIELFRRDAEPARSGAANAVSLVSLDARSPTGGETTLVLDLPSSGDLPTERIDLGAQHVRIIPFALSPTIREAHAAPLGIALGRVAMVHAASPWLQANGAVRFDRETVAEGAETPRLSKAHARGDRLAIALNSQVGVLDGRPATAQWTGDDGTRNSGRAHRIRFRQEAGAPSAVLVMMDEVHPELTMLPSKAGQPSYRAKVEGDVYVTGAEAWCEGPAVLTPLDASGAEDPDGITVRADEVRVRRNRETGEPMFVTAEGNGSFESRDLSGRASLLEIDLLRHTARASEPGGRATVTMDGNTFSARRVQANYETNAVQVWFGSLTWRGDDAVAAGEPQRREGAR